MNYKPLLVHMGVILMMLLKIKERESIFNKDTLKNCTFAPNLFNISTGRDGFVN